MHDTPHSLPAKHFGDSTCICSCVQGYHSDQVRRTVPASQMSLFCQDLKGEEMWDLLSGRDSKSTFYKKKIKNIYIKYLPCLFYSCGADWLCSFDHFSFVLSSVFWWGLSPILSLRQIDKTQENTYSNLQDDINWVSIDSLLRNLNTKHTIMNEIWCRKVKNRVGLSLKMQCLFSKQTFLTGWFAAFKYSCYQHEDKKSIMHPWNVSVRLQTDGTPEFFGKQDTCNWEDQTINNTATLNAPYLCFPFQFHLSFGVCHVCGLYFSVYTLRVCGRAEVPHWQPSLNMWKSEVV